MGVEVDCLMVALLLYADDLAILVESEQDLHDMLNVLHEWTKEFDMSVNIDETKVLHFRRGPSITCTEAVIIIIIIKLYFTLVLKTINI